MTVGIPIQSPTRYFLPVASAAAFLYGAEPAPHTSWLAYLGGADSAQYSALKQVTRANVKQLEPAWTYATGEKGNYLFNPIVIDGVMYVLAKNNSIVALDAATGRELWSHVTLLPITPWARISRRASSLRRAGCFLSPQRPIVRFGLTMRTRERCFGKRTRPRVRGCPGGLRTGGREYIAFRVAAGLAGFTCCESGEAAGSSRAGRLHRLRAALALDDLGILMSIHNEKCFAARLAS